MTKNSKTKVNLLKTTFLALVSAMFVGTIFMAIDIATSGAEISKLESNIYELEQVNRSLTQEVIKHSSVSAIDGESASLGFVKPEKVLYLTIEDAASAYAR